MTEFIRGSLAAKLVIVLAAISIALSLLIGGIEIRRQNLAAIEAEKAASSAIVMAAMDTLALSVRAPDNRMLDIAARSLVLGAGIFRVEVIENGKSRAVSNRPGPQLTSDYEWEVPIAGSNPGQRAATLRIAENYDGIRRQNAQQTANFIMSELVQIISVCILMFFVASKLIGRQSNTLAPARQGRTDTISVPDPQDRHSDEIGPSINATVVAEAGRRQADAQRQGSRSREFGARKSRMFGQVAGGIAHDFGNFLGVIQGFSDLLKESLQNNSKQLRYAERIFQACNSCRDLIGKFQAYIQADSFERKPVDLISLLRNTETTLSETESKPAQYLFEYAEGAIFVLGDEQSLGELFTGLCVRSSTSADGRIHNVTVRIAPALRAEIENLRPETASSEEKIAGEFDSSSAYVVIRISGPNVANADIAIDHIFQPFIASGSRHAGSGIASSHALRVIESHDGVCHLLFRTGEKVIISVYFPLHAAMVERESRQRPATEKSRKMARVLLIDDEPGSADMLSMALERLGYETVSVTDPGEALAAFEEAPHAWDVAIVGDEEPAIRGRELIAKLKSIRPDIRTVLCIGRAESVNEHAVSAANTSIVLLKPVDAATIDSIL